MPGTPSRSMTSSKEAPSRAGSGRRRISRRAARLRRDQQKRAACAQHAADPLEAFGFAAQRLAQERQRLGGRQTPRRRPRPGRPGARPGARAHQTPPRQARHVASVTGGPAGQVGPPRRARGARAGLRRTCPADSASPDSTIKPRLQDLSDRLLRRRTHPSAVSLIACWSHAGNGDRTTVGRVGAFEARSECQIYEPVFCKRGIDLHLALLAAAYVQSRPSIYCSSNDVPRKLEP